jgi:hypothetical protein
VGTIQPLDDGILHTPFAREMDDLMGVHRVPGDAAGQLVVEPLGRRDLHHLGVGLLYLDG